MDEIWAIVLAAGESKRMKTQKLLLPYNGSTIIQAVIENILQSGIKNVMVVLGSHRESVREATSHLPVNYCFNRNYKEGMHTSVSCGFKALPVTAAAVLLFLGDQPFIPPAVTKNLINAWYQSRKGIIMPVTGGKRGHPTLFDMKYRQEILTLDPEKGLHSISFNHPDDVYLVDCNSTEIIRDIDTENDYLNELNLIKDH